MNGQKSNKKRKTKLDGLENSLILYAKYTKVLKAMYNVDPKHTKNANPLAGWGTTKTA